MRFALATACILLAMPPAAQVAPDTFFDSNGVQIRYVEQGTGDPVLLIHGLTASIETNWITPGVFQELAKSHHVVAFDLRGHGKSAKPHDPSAYGGQTVTDALRLLDHLHIQRAHFVGYSVGAIITAKLATTNPERFITATLGGHAGYRNWKPDYDQSWQRIASELESDVPFRGLVVSMNPRDQPPLTEDQIREKSAALAAINDVKALAAWERGGGREFNSTDEEIAAVKVPVLGVMGSLDNVASMQTLQKLLPSMQLVIVDGATHVGDRGVVRRPEFVAAIRQFIDAHPGAR